MCFVVEELGNRPNDLPEKKTANKRNESDQSVADVFLNTFARFTNRRAVPKEMTSDNGTNFVGAVNELKELVNRLDQDKIQRLDGQGNIKWKFNPPAAPHFGGVLEAMVKAAKKAVYAVLGNSEVTDEELITACTGVEGPLNSRSLTYQSADPRDNVPLTPNHFLHGQAGGNFAPEFSGAKFLLRRSTLASDGGKCKN